MMTSLQFLHTTLPDLDTHQLLTQSDLRFLHNWTVKFAPLSSCHVTHDDVINLKPCTAPLSSCHVTLDDVMMTSLFAAPSWIRAYAYGKFE